MKNEFLESFNLMREIFGVCPDCECLFRLSDVSLHHEGRRTKDWMDDLDDKTLRLDRMEEKINQEEQKIREKARELGRKVAQKRMRTIMRKIDPVFTPMKLNPADAKLLLHPVDYIVFDGMQHEDTVRKIVFIDERQQERQQRIVQDSILNTIEKGNMDWVTVRLLDDGKITTD